MEAMIHIKGLHYKTIVKSVVEVETVVHDYMVKNPIHNKRDHNETENKQSYQLI